MRVASYKNTTLDERYDAIIVGSGLGGLTTALLLAQRGKRVLVLERHWVLGGFTHVFKRKEWEWDVGVHYVGEVHREGSVLRRLFDHLTDGELQWADMGEVYDRIWFGDTEYALRSGVKNFKADMSERFPAEKDAIARYLDLVFEVSKASRSFYAEKALGDVTAFLGGRLLRRSYMSFARRTTYDVLRELTSDEKLIGVLTGQYGDYGLPPRQSSFAMHATLVKHYFSGGAYPIGGSARIAETFAPRIEALGGTLVTRAAAEEIVVEHGKAVGVRMEDGRTLRADMVISNAGVLNTFGRLLGDVGKARVGATDKLAKLRPSLAHASLYIGLDGSRESLNLPRANHWVYPDDYDHDRTIARFEADEDAPLPVAYISFPSAKDPSHAQRHPDKSTIEIVTLMPWQRVAKWADTPWKKRGEEYDALKERWSNRLLAKLYEREPHLQGKIAFHELSTPLSTQHFTAYQHGEIYGLSHDPNRFEQRFLRPQTPVSGLYLTGQDVCTCGVGGALVSGFLTASAITRSNMLMDVLRA
ncbi:MAG: phytoene desaturase family protein [Nannocystaceae bacterium]|nr:NAD(P)/FAD-dependent oxidoreductase [bacterium]